MHFRLGLRSCTHAAVGGIPARRTRRKIRTPDSRSEFPAPELTRRDLQETAAQQNKRRDRDQIITRILNLKMASPEPPKTALAAKLAVAENT